jgi:hypothetical protein
MTLSLIRPYALLRFGVSGEKGLGQSHLIGLAGQTASKFRNKYAKWCSPIDYINKNPNYIRRISEKYVNINKT